VSLRFILVLLFCTAAGDPSAAEEPGWKPNFRDRSQSLLGGYVYERNCLVCHGMHGDGQGELAPTLIPRPRTFRTGVFKYRSTPTGKLPTNADLTRIVRGGLAGTAMGMFKDLTEYEVRAVVEYVKSFSSRWRERANFAPPVVVPDRPLWWGDEVLRRLRSAEGRTIFLTHCAACHGQSGDGKSPAAAALRDIWNQPSPPADLRRFFRRNGDEPEDAYRTLVTGIDGTPMVSFEKTLDDEQRWAVVAFLETLRPRPAMGE